jgi:hypothetical protein
VVCDSQPAKTWLKTRVQACDAEPSAVNERLILRPGSRAYSLTFSKQIERINAGMSYRFRLRGTGFRHSWEKECKSEVAMAHATSVAREYARDSVYQDATIRVFDDLGNEVAIIPVSKSPRT